MNPLTEDEVRARFEEARTFPEFLDTQSDYELKKIHHYTSKVFGNAWDLACSEAAGVEDDFYPDEYQNKLKQSYWLDKNERYQDSRKIRDLIEQKIAERNNESSFPNEPNFSDITIEDVVYKYHYFNKEVGLERFDALVRTRAWLADNDINPDDNGFPCKIPPDNDPNNSFYKYANIHREFYLDRKQ